MSSEPTHAELVTLAARWLRGTRKCSLVATERKPWVTDEHPDAIGWRPRGESILVEAKTSVADFLADLRKPHRAGAGMGRERWYLTPSGLLAHRMRPDLWPADWGLLEVRNGKVYRVVEAVDRGPAAEVLAAELPLLVAITRNVLEGRAPGLSTEAGPERCSRCGLNPDAPEHEGCVLYTCDGPGCGVLVCSSCSENATRDRVLCLTCAAQRPREVVNA